MSVTLTKNYGDLTLLFVSDIHGMWTELETKVNTTGLDSTDVASGWATWAMVTLEKDTDYTMGLTSSGIVRFYSTDNTFVFAHDTNAKITYFKINGTEVAQVDTSANFKVKKDVFFYNRSTVYGLSYLIGYEKPVLVYLTSTTIQVEQNTNTAHRTLIVFPSGPIAVTEDISATHKFRKLVTSATANGYSTSHTGAADSGMKSGVTLTANTWYFVYAVIVRGGDDVGNNYIMVADSVNPTPGNWSTLDTSYGSGGWVYLGMFRYGHGGAQTTTMVPFIQDHQGWLTFTGRAASGNFFGIRVASTTISSTSYTTLETFTAANSGDAAPANVSIIKGTIRPVGDGDSDFHGAIRITDGSDVTLWELPSFGSNLSDNEAHGWEFKLPNVGLKLKGRRGVNASEDWDVTAYISAVLDEWV